MKDLHLAYNEPVSNSEVSECLHVASIVSFKFPSGLEQMKKNPLLFAALIGIAISFIFSG